MWSPPAAAPASWVRVVVPGIEVVHVGSAAGRDSVRGVAGASAVAGTAASVRSVTSGCGVAGTVAGPLAVGTTAWSAVAVGRAAGAASADESACDEDVAGLAPGAVRDAVAGSDP